mgnify:FL=1
MDFTNPQFLSMLLEQQQRQTNAGATNRFAGSNQAHGLSKYASPDVNNIMAGTGGNYPYAAAGGGNPATPSPATSGSGMDLGNMLGMAAQTAKPAADMLMSSRRPAPSISGGSIAGGRPGNVDMMPTGLYGKQKPQMNIALLARLLRGR